MKKCSGCQQIKDLSEFNKSKTKRDGHSYYCRSCDNARSREYYKGYGIKRRQINKERIASNQRQITDYLKRHSCVDCGYTKSPVALTFDHIVGTKKQTISRMVRDGYSWETILEEINKCEVRCANCHLEKTAKDYNWFSNSW